MAMQYKYVTPTVTAGAETTIVGITSTQSEPKRIHYLVSGLSADNIDLLVYQERMKLVDIPVDVLNTQQRVVELELDIPVGQSLYVGFRNKTGSSISGDIAIAYEVTGAR
jgi:hypothetical protein